MPTARSSDRRRAAFVAVGSAALLVGAAFTNDAAFLRLIPAWVYVCLAGACIASVRDGESLIERAARWLVPEAPDFISGYCRVVTALWAVFFLASAAVIGALAIRGAPGAWLTFTGQTVWILMAGLMGVEFLVRKTWFRYYARGGPFERFWSTLFPADRTARGRRSLAAIEAWRARSSVG